VGGHPRRGQKLRKISVFCALASMVLLAACAPPSTPRSDDGATRDQPSRRNTLVLATSAPIPAFSYAFLGTSGGGTQSFNELWMQGLVTSARTSPAPEPRIAVELPSIDRGTARLSPDGRMAVTWRIRPEVKWADGADLTARDYAFGLEIMKDRDNPLAGATLVVNIGPLVESIDVLDDKTLVMNWTQPFYQFDAMGFFALQPMPSHVLRAVWDERNMDAFANHSYWRGDYFQVGPYRPTKFEPSVEMVLEAVPHYFLGRPKIDTITIKQYADSNVAYAAVLAKAIDMTADNTLKEEQGVELKRQWERTGEGRVPIGYGTSRGIFPMFKPEYQAEPAMLEQRVRQALFTAVDRETWAAAMLSGHAANTANSLLPPAHNLYEFTADSLRAYRYDPQEALRVLAEAGWGRAADGALTNRADGRRFKVEVWTTQDNEREASILADMWRQIGIESPLFIIPNAQLDNRELRQSFTGVEISARGYADHILTRAECSTLPTPPRYSAANRGHYCNPEMDRLITAYRGSITRADQGRSIAAVARLHAQDLPMMQLYFNLSHPTIVRGLNALADDFGGGLQASGYYGSYFRNAHEWAWTE
jgi:peptide/nickel transport system substrate-binding protein